ncbi:hypothetical protein CANINC_000920 [Pichia inconspicua]|uniref:Uncharacterized protein n=1 Tax=Pichia inconspicua TaxID=52247 RepID=A0A4T0X5H4_9ASCO|nr:hypothetical protein CANINC_000920 [[Candida] inconspicua]
MLPKAQRRLIAAIERMENLIQPAINKPFKVGNWFNNYKEDLKLHVPRVEVNFETCLTPDESKWNVKPLSINVEKAKRILLRESLKLSDSSKSWMTICIQQYNEEPLEPILPVERNPLLIEVIDPIIDYTEQSFNKTRWEIDIVDDLFDEPIEEFCLSNENQDIESSIPPFFLISDLKVTLSVLAESNYTATYRISKRMKKKWKLKIPVNWIVDSSVKRDIFDELVSKFEVAFCVPVPHLEFESEDRLYVDKKRWSVSTYKTYMLSWKLSVNGNVRDVLEEKCDYSVVIPMMKDDLCKYIKMEEIEKSNFVSALENIPITLQHNYLSLNELEETPDTLPIVTPQEDISLSNHSSELADDVVNSTKNSFLISPKTASDKEIVASSNASQSTPDSTVSKHKIDEMDTLVLKKKQKVQKTVMLDNKKYPYLDVFNQTTTFNLLPQTRKEVGSVPGTKELVHVPMVLPQEAKEQILENTEQSINESLFDVVPVDKRLWLFVNISFGDRFGAAFLQLSELVVDVSQVELLDFADCGKGLEFDMFLNVQCGAIFLRPINIYQRDLKSGEDIIFSQIAEIAHTVTSLVLVIVVDEDEDDPKVEQFVKLAESYGIEIFVLENNAKKIAQAMVELALKYGELQKREFEWNSGHQFLEACGVQNPLLQEWILDKCTVEEFVSLSVGSREQLLGPVCSDELIRIVNGAVQRFVECLDAPDQG